MSTFAETTLLGATLFGALFVGLSLTGRRLPFMLLGAGGGILYLCCALAFAYFSWFGSPNDAPIIALSTAVALGDACLALAWGRICARFKIKRALVAVSLASMLSAGICFLYAVLPLPGVTVLFVLSSIVAVIVPLAFSGMAHDGDEAAPERPEGRTASATIASLADVIVAPGLGLLVFAFVMGVRKFLGFDLFYVEALGGIVAALVVLPLCLVKTERPLLSLIYQVLLPLFALMLVVLNSFPVGTVLQWLAATFSYVFYGVVGILALASLCAMAHAREFPPTLIYGLTVSGFALASLGGIMCGALPPFEDQQGGPILLVVSTIYFAVLVAAPLLMAWRREGRDGGDVVLGRAGEGAPTQLQQRCERIAGDRGLSPRETEVLAYLGRGHGIVFVASTLVISESTVRTHVKSIYRKLEVSSREELLQLIDEG